MRVLLKLLLAFVLIGNVAAQSKDQIGDALDGAWLVSVGEGSRDRFLILSGARLETGKVLVNQATYGYVDGKGKPVNDWRGEVSGDVIHLHFLTPAQSAIDVRFPFGTSALEGSMNTAEGKIFPVRWTRIDPEELQSLRLASQANRRVTEATSVHKDSKISLVYIGAADCPACRGYEAEFFGRMKKMAQIFPEFSTIQYVKVSLGSYKGTLSAGVFPPELEWLAGVGPTGKPVLRKRGTPFFAAVVDQKVIAQGHGVGALETLVAPAVKAAMSERGALQGK